MPVPTLTSVAPRVGHTGGQTLVELNGTGFALAPDPDLTQLPVPPAPPRLRVFFGGTEAYGVQVVSSTLAYAFTPIHDAGAVAVEVRNQAPRPATLLTEEGPFTVAAGDTLEIAVGAEVQVATIPVDVGAGPASAAQVASAVSMLRGVRVRVEGDRVRILSDANGPAAHLHVLGGATAAALGLDDAEASGSAELEDVDGERATMANGFTFALPDLRARSPLVRVVEALMGELGRQIVGVENVHVATDPDYDGTPESLTNLAWVAKLPGLLIYDMQLLHSVAPRDRGAREVMTAEGRSVVVAPTDYRDIQFFVVGVARGYEEGLNFLTAWLEFGRKNEKIYADMADGCREGFELYVTSDQNVSAQALRGGQALSTFQGMTILRGVPILGVVPRGDDGTRPAGVQPGAPHEGVRELGVPQVEPPEFAIVPKSEIDAEDES